MGKLQRIGSLENDQDIDFERRQLQVQRVGWVVILIFLLAGRLTIDSAPGGGTRIRAEIPPPVSG